MEPRRYRATVWFTVTPNIVLPGDSENQAHILAVAMEKGLENVRRNQQMVFQNVMVAYIAETKEGEL